MRVFVTVEQGPATGRQLVLQAEPCYLVGRTTSADLPLPHDTEMSGRHFTLECADDQCLLRDRNSTNGTFVNGLKVSEAVIHDGDEILAGTTTFRVSIQSDVAEPPSEPATRVQQSAPVAASTPAPTAAGPEPAARVILEILDGECTGRRLSLPTGTVGLVGRTTKADLPVTPDKDMSGRHFVLEWRDGECRLRDLGSTNGTFINGQRTEEAPLRHGDQIVAGTTRFAVIMPGETSVPSTRVSPAVPTVESSPAAGALPHSPPPEEATEPEEETALDHLVERLRKVPEPLFALVDAARDPRVLELLQGSKLVYQSLYEGPQGETLAPWAPYLVQLRQGTSFLETLVHEGWGESWGIYLTATQTFAEVRRHFRRFLLVEDPEGKQVYFRFYDPRVLRVFLPTCNAEQLAELFGPIRRYLLEGQDADILLEFTPGPRGLRKEVVGLWLNRVLATESVAVKVAT